MWGGRRERSVQRIYVDDGSRQVRDEVGKTFIGRQMAVLDAEPFC